MSYFSIQRTEIEELLPESVSVAMDIGCGTGVTSKWLADRYGCTTIGVEIEEKAWQQASKVLDNCYLESINQDGAYISKHQNQVDLLLLLDILEHLEDPWARLSALRSVLHPSASVISSIPNVRNLKVLLPLIFKGEWQYVSEGILDRTHLRFFTKNSIISLFEEAGFSVEKVLVTGPTRLSEINSTSGYLAFFANKLLFGKLQGFIAHQYIVLAKVNPSAQVK